MAEQIAMEPQVDAEPKPPAAPMVKVITSAERRVNDQINQLYEEKNSLIKQIENQDDAYIINQLSSMRENLDDIDKNKGTFYNKYKSKKYEINKRPLNELLNQELKNLKLVNKDDEPQICSKHLSNDTDMLKFNRPYIDQIDQYYQRLDQI